VREDAFNHPHPTHMVQDPGTKPSDDDLDLVGPHKLPSPNRILNPDLHAQVPGTKPSDDQLDLVIGSTYDGLRGNRYESASPSDTFHT